VYNDNELAEQTERMILFRMNNAVQIQAPIAHAETETCCAWQTSCDVEPKAQMEASSVLERAYMSFCRGAQRDSALLHSETYIEKVEGPKPTTNKVNETAPNSYSH